MAKVKKEKLSLEELLEEALVKEEDRPYEVPGNWVWTRLENLVSVLGDGLHGTPIYSEQGDYYFINGNNLNNGFIDFKDNTKKVHIEEFLKYKKTLNDRTVFVSINGTLGNLAFYNNEKIILGKSACYFNLFEKISKNYIMYLIKSEDFINYANRVATGSTIKNVSLKSMRKFKIPLPPLAEQQRIVEVIESLFEKLDKAKEMAQNALDSFENRKAVILHKAFTGELTAKWREENGVSLDSWEIKPLKNICSKITDGEHFRPPIVEKGIPFLSAKDVREEGVSFDNILYITMETAKKALKRCKPEQGDILIVSRGATVGRMCVVNTDITFCLLGSVILLKTKDVLSKLTCYYLKSPEINQIIIQASGATAQPALYLRDIKEINLPIPSHTEQNEIVRILDNLLENEEHAKELCDVIEKIDLMKKAILARAFRGELCTNDQREESAVESLKEVLKEKI